MPFYMQQKVTVSINKEVLSKRIIRSLMCLDKLYEFDTDFFFNGKIVHILGTISKI